MEICTLASSSKGNCTLVSHQGRHILIDAGISLRRIRSCLSALGIGLPDVSAVLITHEHTDHIQGLPMLTAHCPLPICAPAATAAAILRKVPKSEPLLRPFSPGMAFELDGFQVQSFPTPHDVPSVGYRIRAGSREMALVTDLGHVTEDVRQAVSGVDLAIVEANHDLDMLRHSRYPYFLKQRIAGDRGHLSNPSSGDLAAALVASGTRQLVLAHLSGDNNTPQLAGACVAGVLEAAGFQPGRDLRLTVAPREQMGAPYILA